MCGAQKIRERKDGIVADGVETTGEEAGSRAADQVREHRNRNRKQSNRCSGEGDQSDILTGLILVHLRKILSFTALEHPGVLSSPWKLDPLGTKYHILYCSGRPKLWVSGYGNTFCP